MLRYLGGGLLNTFVGLSVIFVLMSIAHATPLVANILGYLASVILGFITSKVFVFRSNVRHISESMRYAAAFCASFLVNLLTLHIGLTILHQTPAVAQIAAAAAYTVTMYSLSRLFVFKVQ